MAENRLRIAFVVHDYNRHGGHSRYVAELATRYRRDHEVHVYTNTVDDPDTAGISFHHVPAWRPNALASILSFIIPATLMVRSGYDIVHAQGLCGLRQNVVTAHICQPAWFAAADRHSGPSGWRKRIFRVVVRGLDRLVMRPGAAAAFIAPSARVKDDLAAHHGISTRVWVVLHGTDTTQFHPDNRDRFRGAVRDELGLSGTECVAMYAGDLQKALPAAIRAVAQVPGIRLVAVSKSEPSPYRAMAEAAGIARRVVFVPPTHEVNRYYAAADLFLFPTYYDAFGLVVTEAMATGLPVITSRAAGAAELIEHGVDGLLTDAPWDETAISEHLVRLRNDPALRERLGRAARAKIEPYTWDRTAAETMAVYQHVVATRPERRRDG